MDLELDRLVGAQWGLLTRSQARACGLSAEAVRWRLARHWRVVLPGVLVVHRAELQPRQRLLAAQLFAGADSVVTGAAAAAWYGLEHARPGPTVTVVVPGSKSARTCRWVDVRRSVVDPCARSHGPLRVAGPERAVMEAIRDGRGLEGATALVIEVLQRRLTTLDRPTDTHDRLSRRGSRLSRRALAAAAGGAWSLPELGLAHLVSRSTVLPEMWANPDLYDAAGRRVLTPDGWYDDVALAVMVHSRRYHDGPQFARTLDRDGQLVALGVSVLPVTPQALQRDPDRVLSTIERAYVAARRVGRRPDVRAVRWAPWVGATGS